jgi:hypothetical protein
MCPGAGVSANELFTRTRGSSAGPSKRSEDAEVTEEDPEPEAAVKSRAHEENTKKQTAAQNTVLSLFILISRSEILHERNDSIAGRAGL